MPWLPSSHSENTCKVKMFKRLFKVKNVILLFGISFRVLEIFLVLYYANEENDDVITCNTIKGYVWPDLWIE